MRNVYSLFVTLVLCTSTLAYEYLRSSFKPEGKVCNPEARGPNLEKLQREAFADYVNLWVTNKDVLTAYNRYVPGFVRSMLAAQVVY